MVGRRLELALVMDTLIRLLARILLVPLGMLAAVVAAVGVAAASNWAKFAALIAEPVIDLAALFAASTVLLVQSIAVAFMLLPGAIAIILSEAFALRAWWFHAPAGALSIWIGWSTMDDFRSPYALFENPVGVIAAGIAAGFAYWAVAGWNAGFWKPVFADGRPSRMDPELETSRTGSYGGAGKLL
jgi:hypothetical protein